MELVNFVSKALIKRSASSRKNLKIAMPFARVRVILQCWNIKLEDYWTGDYVFHGNWSRKVLYVLFKRISSVRKFKKTCDQIWTSSNQRKPTQANASHRKLVVKRGTSRHKLKLAMTCVFVWSGLNVWERGIQNIQERGIFQQTYGNLDLQSY